MNKDSASQFCKDNGLVSLVELSEICNKSVRTLNYYFCNNRVFFECLVYGAAVKKSNK